MKHTFVDQIGNILKPGDKLLHTQTGLIMDVHKAADDGITMTFCLPIPQQASEHPEAPVLLQGFYSVRDPLAEKGAQERVEKLLTMTGGPRGR